ncbi:general odorant-binding protein 28a-like [Ptiloglossa arizonensis]|uniref:general odorant-binding protein 28a-like n=1 Tax=Ptiloglossa arizonensis TaxID=3350558 RepID=UPI003FA133DE
MKGLLVVSCLLLTATIARGDSVDIYLEKNGDQLVACGKENGFTEQTPREIYEKDAKAGVDAATCLRACVLKSLNMVKNSKMDLEGSNQFVETIHSDNPEMIEKLQKGVAECAEKVNGISDECKMSYSFVDCFLDKH